MYEIRMNHPSMNALGRELMDWLEAELSRAGGEPVLISSGGRAFSAGLDLKLVATLKGDKMRAFLKRLDRLIELLYHYPGPTVALVEGHAIAGGCVLANTCDHRVAKDHPKIRIGLNEVAIGVTFPPRILALLRQRLPRQHRDRVLLGADLHAPAQALALGLLDEVAEDPRPLALARLEALAAHPSTSYAATKAILRADIAPSIEDEEHFYNVNIPIWTSDVVRAKIRAALGG